MRIGTLLGVVGPMLCGFGLAAATVQARPLPAQFDLKCVMAGTPAIPEPYATHYTVDLGGRRWCENSCDRPKGLSVAGKTAILLDGTKAGNALDFRLDLLTLRIHALMAYGNGREWTESCRVAPFSGFRGVRSE